MNDLHPIAYDDLCRLAKALHVNVGQATRVLEGEAVRGVSDEQAVRIRALAAELRSRAPASRRVRVADPWERTP